MKKKMWLTLCNIGVSVVFLLSLYSYTKGMRLFSLGLAMALLIEIGIRGLIKICLRYYFGNSSVAQWV